MAEDEAFRDEDMGVPNGLVDFSFMGIGSILSPISGLRDLRGVACCDVAAVLGPVKCAYWRCVPYGWLSP